MSIFTFRKEIDLQKIIICWLLFGLLMELINIDSYFYDNTKILLAQNSNPCNSPIATCITKSDGSRWCSFPQQTMMLCSSPKIKIQNSIKKTSGTINRYTPPSCREKCESSYQNCMANVNADRASEGAGEFSAATDAAKYSNCKISRNTCYKKCQ